MLAAYQEAVRHFFTVDESLLGLPIASLGGFVGLPRTRDLVLVLVGDHQPPAVVSGEGAPWDVPVHVVSSRGSFLDALTSHGFVRGMHPPRKPLMRLHELMPLLTSAMGGHSPS